MLEGFFGIKDLPEDAKHILMKFFYLILTVSFFASMGQSFILLHFIDIQGFRVAGLLMSIVAVSQLVSDYPSGSLGDFIGQRFVLSLSFLFFSLAFFTMSLNEDFNAFIFSAVFIGLGLGQNSGAVETWLDNNYKKTSQNKDPEGKMYGFATQRMGTIIGPFTAISFIIGGVISTFYGRTNLFLVTGIFLLLLIPFILFYMRDVSIKEKEGKKSNNYLSFFKGGISYLFSSKKAFFLLLGVAVIDLAFSIWFTLILFPVYFGYSGSDAGVGILRGFIFLVGGITGIFVANLSKKFSNENFAAVTLLTNLLFFSGMTAVLYFFPPKDAFDNVGTTLLILQMAIFIGIFLNVAFILRQRVMMKTIPSEFRNSIYSLLPTMTITMQIPLLIFMGGILENGGLLAGLQILLIIGLIGPLLLFISQFYGEGVELELESSSETPANV
ncbi:MAG: MFS transporter [Candidatus Kariarchaeaceae archaeon]|jgi:MFS family permease